MRRSFFIEEENGGCIFINDLMKNLESVGFVILDRYNDIRNVEKLFNGLDTGTDIP